MPVKRDASGRRYVEAQVEVPGTPEEVWEAIATGPGISAWFVPSEVEETVGGTVLCHFGPGNSMDSVSTITEWQPPLRFVAESRDDMGPEDPTVATEWSVQARSGGVCVVRVVHSWFSSKDDWDNQFEGHSYGWLAFFRLLRLYLEHFSGRASRAFQLMGVAAEPKEEAWEALTTPLGLIGAAVGDRVEAGADAPPFSGVVEYAGPPEWPELLVRLASPAPGIAHLLPHAMGGKVYLSLRFFFYGEDAAAVVARLEPRWNAWITERFAPVEMPGS